MKLKKQLLLDIEMNPEEVAYLFCEMDEKEQARFFNSIAERIKKWDMGFIFQMQSVTDCKDLTDEARKIMKEIGDYSQHNP